MTLLTPERLAALNHIATVGGTYTQRGRHVDVQPRQYVVAIGFLLKARLLTVEDEYGRLLLTETGKSYLGG